MKSFKNFITEEPNTSLDEISKDLMRRYYNKALDSHQKAYKARDRAQKRSTKVKHFTTMDKRNKGIGSVMKRDFARKSGQDYITKPGTMDAIMRGDKGASLTTKRSDQLHKNYKGR